MWKRILVRLATAAGFLFAATAIAQTGFTVGISVHLASHPDALPAQLSLIVQAGANSLRDDVGWDQVEREKDHLVVPAGFDDFVDACRRVNIQPLLILDYGNRLYGGDKPLSPAAQAAFVRYAVFVVQHFKGRVHMYEMWNEWNVTTGGTHPGTAEDYARFLRVVYPAVKAADPDAIFLGGAIGGLNLDWLSAMLSAGAIGFFDGLSIHPYNFSKSERTGDSWAQDMMATERVIHGYTHGRDVPLYITEMGWPTYSGTTGISPEMAGAYLTQMFLLARTMNFIKGIWWYDFREDGRDHSNKENDFGLVDPDLVPKPGFSAFKSVAPLVKGAQEVQDLPSGDPSIRALLFRLTADQQVIALWTKDPAASAQVWVKGNRLLQIRSVEAEANDGLAANPNVKQQLVHISATPVLVTGEKLSLLPSRVQSSLSSPKDAK